MGLLRYNFVACVFPNYCHGNNTCSTTFLEEHKHKTYFLLVMFASSLDLKVFKKLHGNKNLQNNSSLNVLKAFCEKSVLYDVENIYQIPLGYLVFHF